MSDPATITIETRDQIAVVTFDRSMRANAFDAATAREVGRAVELASGDARAVILTGAGRTFCAGGDLDELERWSYLPPDQIGRELYGSFQSMIRAVRATDAIVIAAINGAAVGAGLDLALACDLRIAASGAKLGQVWVGLGVIPGTGGAWLTQALGGPTRAAELLLTGRLIAAEEAREVGLVNDVLPAGMLLTGARKLAERILQHPRDGVIANKRAMVAATEAQLEAALAHAALVQPQRFASDEFRAALASRKG